jgi:hypothetical protein
LTSLKSNREQDDSINDGVVLAAFAQRSRKKHSHWWWLAFSCLQLSEEFLLYVGGVAKSLAYFYECMLHMYIGTVTRAGIWSVVERSLTIVKL